jgi:hypothetical protein
MLDEVTCQTNWNHQNLSSEVTFILIARLVKDITGFD